MMDFLPLFDGMEPHAAGRHRRPARGLRGVTERINAARIHQCRRLIHVRCLGETRNHLDEVFNALAKSGLQKVADFPAGAAARICCGSSGIGARMASGSPQIIGQYFVLGKA